MAVEKDFELLDDYLSNKLTGEERSAFEQKLESDPTLKNELQFQQDLVNGIRKARAAELKSMLNNIPVSSIPSAQSSLVKVGAWVVVAGLVISGLYFILSDDEKVMEQPQEELVAEEPHTTPEPDQEPTTEPAVATSTPADATTHQPAVVAPEQKTKSASKPAINVYDPSKEEVPPVAFDAREQLDIISKAFVTSSIAVEADNASEYKFHYVFKDHKLILYGLFEKDLYEILEFLADDQRTVFLYYKSAYYWLDINQTTPARLIPIRDKKLLTKLKQFRKN